MSLSSARTLIRIASWQVMYLFAADVEHVHKPLLKPAPARALPAPRALNSRALCLSRVHAGADENRAGKVDLNLFVLTFNLSG